MNKPISFIICFTTLFITACTPKEKLQQPETELSPIILNKNTQTAQPDFYAMTPKVIRYDRYLLINTSPTLAQRDLLEQMIDIHIPTSQQSSISDAMRYILQPSGYSLCKTTSSNQVLYNQKLPVVHHQLGPMRLKQALQILAGVAWQLEIDVVQRIVCHSLREGYQLPPEIPINSTSLGNRMLQ
ncbi:TPA: PilL N-terminal domain-containing protein [Proteus mirabilis]|nr:PilL N-terminal domain-containing protein [Proteus mirabilis]HEK1080938.1 PilL N-terminal domain-containing protein [Proteus mirabilis]